MRPPHGLAWAHPQQRPAWSQYSLTIAPSAVRRRVMICLPQAEHRRISSGDGASENGGGVGRGNRGSWRLSRLLAIFIG